jgi:hypothetical protein
MILMILLGIFLVKKFIIGAMMEDSVKLKITMLESLAIAQMNVPLRDAFQVQQVKVRHFHATPKTIVGMRVMLVILMLIAARVVA